VSYTHELAEKIGVLRPNEKSKLKEALAEIDQEEARTVRMLASGKISETVWDDLWSEWQDRRQQISRTLETLEHQHSYHLDNLESALKIIASVGELYNGLERKDQKDLLRQIAEVKSRKKSWK
jgi:hypothetical protein